MSSPNVGSATCPASHAQSAPTVNTQSPHGARWCERSDAGLCQPRCWPCSRRSCPLRDERRQAHDHSSAATTTGGGVSPGAPHQDGRCEGEAVAGEVVARVANQDTREDPQALEVEARHVARQQSRVVLLLHLRLRLYLLRLYLLPLDVLRRPTPRRAFSPCDAASLPSLASLFGSALSAVTRTYIDLACGVRGATLVALSHARVNTVCTSASALQQPIHPWHCI